MSRLKSTLLLSGGIALLTACSQEQTIEVSRQAHPIQFRAGFATTRGTEITIDNLNEFLVTAYYNGTTGHMADAEGNIPDPYFENEPFIGNKSQYTSIKAWDWPADDTPVEFFAYYPTLTSVRETYKKDYATYFNLKESDSDYIRFVNGCTDDISYSDPVPEGTSKFVFDESTLLPGYKLARYYVPFDISEHKDFITAHYKGTKTEHEMTGMKLIFRHQLSQIEVRGFNESTFYDIEVAGLRIGYPIVAGAMFNFCGNNQGALEDHTGGKWEFATNPLYHPVEYIYRGGEGGDFILTLTKDEEQVSPDLTGAPVTHKTHILTGDGGNAMVLPTKLKAWDGVSAISADDPRMYFSVLMRVVSKKTATEDAISQLYPYISDTKREGMEIIYYAVEINDGRISTRLYKNDNAYYDNPSFTGEPYRLKVNEDGVPIEEIREYGWASTPVEANWELGKKYVYTLDYSSGVGLKDPDDPKPGEPILGGNIILNVDVKAWDSENKELDVPTEAAK